VSVDDEEMLGAVRFILTRVKLVVKLIAVMTVAALLSCRFRGGAALVQTYEEREQHYEA